LSRFRGSAALALLLAICAIGTGGTAHAQAHWTAFSDPAGQLPMPLVLDDLNGKAVDLASFKGRVVLLNFLATWCDGCRAELPALNRLQQRFGSAGLVVVGVNVGEGKARIAEFTEHVPIEFLVLRDADSAVLKRWRVRIMPSTFLIDRHGMLRAQLVGEADWDAAAVQAPMLDLLR
ncbi:MAG: TlpA family protein disulfide reductase, partial [Pseudomonadota bacterium]|nr:TlpA family protein disulfide reductase [Pseudomonadota bacterium]